MIELRGFLLAFRFFAGHRFRRDSPEKYWSLAFRLAGTKNIDSCASPLSGYVPKDDFTGTCNDVIAPIADQGASSTWVLVFDGTESEANTEK